MQRCRGAGVVEEVLVQKCRGVGAELVQRFFCKKGGAEVVQKCRGMEEQICRDAEVHRHRLVERWCRAGADVVQ